MKTPLDNDLDKVYKAFNQKHDDLRQTLMASLADRSKQHKKTSRIAHIKAFIGDTIMKSKITKLAAAAVIIIIAVLVGINQFGGSIDGASVAFAEIQKAVNEMPMMYKTIQTNRGGQKHYTERWYCFEPRIILSKYTANGECNKISSMDYDTMENVVYEPDSNVVTILWRVDVSSSNFPITPWSIVGDYVEDYVRWGAEVRYEKGSYEGDDVDIYHFSVPRNFRDDCVEAELIVNRSSHLPMLYKIKTWKPGGKLESDQVISFDFSENGPKDIYDLGVARTTEVVYDWESKKRLDRKMELLEDKAVYEKRFKEIYRLEEDEVLKHIPLSLAKPRIKIDEINNTIRILEREGSPIMPPLSSGEIKRMNKEDHYTMFSWDGERAKGGKIFPDGVSLETAFERIIVLSQFQYDSIPDTLSSIKIPGDWVVRNGAPKEQLLEAFESILQDFTKRPIRFEKRQVERNVIVARGEFHFKPLTGTYDDSWIHVFSDKLDPDESGGGGTYSLDRFLTQRLAETQLKQHVVNLTEPSDNLRIKCGCHMSAYLGKIVPGPERDAKLDLLLENLSRQTSLVFTKEFRKVDIWYVVEDGQD